MASASSGSFQVSTTSGGGTAAVEQPARQIAGAMNKPIHLIHRWYAVTRKAAGALTFHSSALDQEHKQDDLESIMDVVRND